jgi:hypothetical protein
MKPPRYDESTLTPLDSDRLIEARVTQLIGRANMRQLWLLFLDEDSVQLPVLIPIDGLPSHPNPTNVDRIAGNIAELMDGIGAAAVILVWERYGPEKLGATDAEWALALHEACEENRIRLRAMLLSHKAGVRWIAQDDYRY